MEQGESCDVMRVLNESLVIITSDGSGSDTEICLIWMSFWCPALTETFQTRRRLVDRRMLTV